RFPSAPSRLLCHSERSEESRIFLHANLRTLNHRSTTAEADASERSVHQRIRDSSLRSTMTRSASRGSLNNGNAATFSSPLPARERIKGEGPQSARDRARLKIPPPLRAASFVILSAAKNPGSFSTPTTAPSTKDQPQRRPVLPKDQYTSESGILRCAPQ